MLFTKLKASALKASPSITVQQTQHLVFQTPTQSLTVKDLHSSIKDNSEYLL